MARTDDYAFNAMNAGDPDMDAVTGGAIRYSEYDMDMSPKQQKLFRSESSDLFKKLYNADPLADKEKLPYKNWLKTLSAERIKGLSEDYQDKQAPRNPENIIAKSLMSQASKHWGGIEGFESIRRMSLAEEGRRVGGRQFPGGTYPE